jgi:hypothetical protein
MAYDRQARWSINGQGKLMRGSRTIASMVLLVVLGLGAASCATADPPIAAPPNAPAAGDPGPDGSTPEGTTPSGEPGPEADFTTFRGEGEMTTEKALQVFALVFGPVPGVDAPTDPAVAFPGGSATGVIRDVLARFDELTDEQQDAVHDYLLPEDFDLPDGADEPGGVGAPPTSGETEGPAASIARPAAFYQPSDAEDQARAEALVADAVADIQSHTGSSLAPDVVVHLTRTATVGPENAWALAESEVTWLEAFYGGMIGRGLGLETRSLQSPCHLSVTDSVLSGHDDAQVYSSIAHEVFHCFQYWNFGGSVADFNGRPRWVIEGGAGWVGEELAHGSGIAIAQSWWRNYLTGLRGGYEMYDNDGYMAIGFWEHLDTGGADPWHKALDAINQPSSPAAFNFLTGDDPALLAGWAASTVREGWEPPGAWQLHVTDQRPTDDHRSPLSGPLVRGSQHVSAAPGGQGVSLLDPAGDGEYVTVDITSPTTLAWVEGGPGVTVAATSGKSVYCLISDCVCPDGSLPFDGGFTSVGSDKALVVATSGTSSEMGKVTVSGLTTEEVCRPCEGGGASGFAPRFAPAQDPGTCPDPCLVGKWNLDTGDLASQATSVMAPATVTIDGGVVLELDGSRSTVTYSDQMVAVRPMDAGLVMTLRFGWSGTATGTYSGAMGNLTATEESTDVQAAITGDINGQPMPPSGVAFPGGGSVFGGTATYECSGGTLVTHTDGSPFHHTWIRINSPG